MFQFLASRPAVFALGLAAGAIAKNEKVRGVARTATREAIKGALALQDRVGTITDGLREELEDITAEAKSEMEAEKQTDSQE